MISQYRETAVRIAGPVSGQRDFGRVLLLIREVLRRLTAGAAVMWCREFHQSSYHRRREFQPLDCHTACGCPRDEGRDAKCPYSLVKHASANEIDSGEEGNRPGSLDVCAAEAHVEQAGGCGRPAVSFEPHLRNE